jgi:hypothetical protein
MFPFLCVHEGLTVEVGADKHALNQTLTAENASSINGVRYIDSISSFVQSFRGRVARIASCKGGEAGVDPGGRTNSSWAVLKGRNKNCGCPCRNWITRPRGDPRRRLKFIVNE